MGTMNIIDIILGILLLYGLVKGFTKGLFIELSSLIAIVAAIYCATHFSDYVGNFLSKQVMWDEKYVKLAAFAITFVLILIGVAILGRILTKVANFAALGILNKVAGAAFGLLKFAFIASAIIMILNPFNKTLNIISQETLNSSILFEPVADFAPKVLPKIMKEVNDEVVEEN